MWLPSVRAPFGDQRALYFGPSEVGVVMATTRKVKVELTSKRQVGAGLGLASGTSVGAALQHPARNHHGDHFTCWKTLLAANMLVPPYDALGLDPRNLSRSRIHRSLLRFRPDHRNWREGVLLPGASGAR